MSNLRIGIVGIGRIAATHVDAWRATEGVELVAAADESPEARERAAALGLESYGSAEEMLRDARLDAVSVCTPPSTHLALSSAALDRKVAVLCEKPATTSLWSTRRLMSVVESGGGKFQMATKFRHVPELKAARETIAAGGIGQPVHLQIEFAGKVDMSARWNSNPALSGGGVIIDNGSHALDLAEFVLGDLSTIETRRGPRQAPYDVEEAATLHADAANGASVDIVLSWSAPPASDFYATILGSEGSIAIGWKASFLQRTGGEPVQTANGYDKNAVHRDMMARFRDFVLGQDEGWISPREIEANAAAIDAAYRSMDVARQVAVERTEAGLKAA